MIKVSGQVPRRRNFAVLKFCRSDKYRQYVLNNLSERELTKLLVINSYIVSRQMWLTTRTVSSNLHARRVLFSLKEDVDIEFNRILLNVITRLGNMSEFGSISITRLPRNAVGSRSSPTPSSQNLGNANVV